MNWHNMGFRALWTSLTSHGEGITTITSGSEKGAGKKRIRGFENGWASVDKGLPRLASERNTTCHEMTREAGLYGAWEWNADNARIMLDEHDTI